MTKKNILKEIEKVQFLVTEAREILENLNDQQQSDLENYPENLQGSANYERAEEIQSIIEDLLSTLEQAESETDEAIENIESI